jgi:hypothetical protein
VDVRWVFGGKLTPSGEEVRFELFRAYCMEEAGHHSLRLAAAAASQDKIRGEVFRIKPQHQTDESVGLLFPATQHDLLSKK